MRPLRRPILPLGRSWLLPFRNIPSLSEGSGPDRAFRHLVAYICNAPELWLFNCSLQPMRPLFSKRDDYFPRLCKGASIQLRRLTGHLAMVGIPRRHSHFVFGVIQSGLTSLIAAGIASWSLWGSGRFFQNWTVSWLISWAVMLPAVLFAAPAIRWLSIALTHED